MGPPSLRSACAAAGRSALATRPSCPCLPGHLCQIPLASMLSGPFLFEFCTPILCRPTAVACAGCDDGMCNTVPTPGRRPGRLSCEAGLTGTSAGCRLSVFEGRVRSQQAAPRARAFRPVPDSLLPGRPGYGSTNGSNARRRGRGRTDDAGRGRTYATGPQPDVSICTGAIVTATKLSRLRTSYPGWNGCAYSRRDPRRCQC